MLLLILFSIFFTSIYAWIFYKLYKSWIIISGGKKKALISNSLSHVSIIIPARNEERHIKNCIESILANNYPKELIEILVINDDSSDQTADIVRSFELHQVRCINLVEYPIPNQFGLAYKKWAIELGVKLASHDVIITTDADTLMKPTWLSSMINHFITSGAVMLAAPVVFLPEKSMLNTFQRIDFLVMQGITAAVHYLRIGNMCNGANLMFSKAAFNEVGGFSNATKNVSGDDYMLMSKFRQLYPKNIEYLLDKQAIVMTYPPTNWKNFFQQRIRWASKTGTYGDRKIDFILLVVYVFNFLCFLSFIFSIINLNFLALFLVLIFLKILIEYRMVKSCASFFDNKDILIGFFCLQPIHIIYIILSASLSLFTQFKWKERLVK